MALELDIIDISILNLLQKNARISDAEISRIIHLSANSIAARIKQLEMDGYIEHHVTILNKSKVKLNFECFTAIKLTQNSHESISSFLQSTESIPEIYRSYQISSSFDFLLHIVSMDIKDYHQLLIDKLVKIDYVKSVTSFVVLNEFGGLNIIDLGHI